MSVHRYKSGKSKKGGFYVALGICLVAVGAAAWSTYDAVNGFIAPPEEPEYSAVVRSEISETPSPSPTPRPNAEVAGKPDSTPKPSTTPKPATPRPVESAASEAPVESVPEESPVTSAIYEISQSMIYPVMSSNVLSHYSSGRPVFSHTMRDWRIHCGTDFEAESGESVKAVANGMVLSAYTDPMLGNTISIEHGDYVFYYCGLGEEFLVKEGDIVTMGQNIGIVTAAPFESAEDPRLHIEVKRDGVYLDPKEVISSHQQ